MNKKQESYVNLPDGKIGIPLTMGKMAIIDADDLEKVRGRRWQTKVGCSGRTFYARCSMTIEGKRHSVMMHSLILPKMSGMMTDHVDGDGLNNTRKNLRYAASADNQRNRLVLRCENRASPYKGVEINPRWHEGSNRRKWRATITVAGKRIYIGSYHDDVEAAKAYDKSAIIHHGEFANLNFSNTLIAAGAVKVTS